MGEADPMKTICAWCQLVIAEGDGPVSHGICKECMRITLQEILPGVGNVTAGETASNLEPARPVVVRAAIGLSADGIGGIEEGPRRPIFARRNRFRPGVLGNMMLRSGALRKIK